MDALKQVAPAERTIDDHRHAVVLGAWAWILVVGWILGKLHPGGMIH